MEKTALAIMAKVPSSGGKSRLATLLTSGQREELQWAFLGDILDKAHQIKGLSVFLAITPQDQADEMETKFGEINKINQPAGDLGVRMFSVAKKLFEQGFSRVLITGTDSPTLPPDYLVQALLRLKNKPIVFGPTMDGGYYMVGLSCPESRIFKGISWGTSQVLQQTETICKDINLQYSLLPPLEDIDWPIDLLNLKRTLTKGKIRADWFPQRTANFLAKNKLVGKDE
ncbi:MAG: glycosyltransferase [Firmicutes bacterium]|nr:glycosyltransferase [Bacillota bacterium]